MQRYKNSGTISTLPFTNSGSNFSVVVGANFSVAAGTATANTVAVSILVKDAQGASCDSIQEIYENYVGAPASGTIPIIRQLSHKLLVPPGGTVSSPNSIISAIQVIEALDTSSSDGRDSLENALMIST